jgi:hypothetical protein
VGAAAGAGSEAALPLDDLVELAAVEPDAAAGGAIIDLDILPLAHHQRRLVDRAQHRFGTFRLLFAPDLDRLGSGFNRRETRGGAETTSLYICPPRFCSKTNSLVHPRTP